MTDLGAIDPEALLLAAAGTILRNVRRAGGACSFCGGHANSGFSTCYVCGFLPSTVQPDAAGFLTYAADGTTAGTLMYGYKESYGTQEQLAIVKLLAHRGFNHAVCAERLVGSRITHWSTVPSTKGRTDHPLRQSISPFARWPAHSLSHVPGIEPIRRSVQSDLFICPPLPPGAHVLLVDDTWTSGNKPLSGVSTLRTAGADHVSVLCLSRWLGYNFVHGAAAGAVGLPAALAQQSVYELGPCPFTGSECP